MWWRRLRSRECGHLRFRCAETKPRSRRPIEGLETCLKLCSPTRFERNIGSLFKHLSDTLRDILLLFFIVSTCYQALYIIGYRYWCGKTLGGVCKDGSGDDDSESYSFTSKDDFWIGGVCLNKAD